jgi:mRNA degradation ribonuclease J1/J2
MRPLDRKFRAAVDALCGEVDREGVPGFVLTHGYKHRIGGLPYVLRQLPRRISATRLTVG